MESLNGTDTNDTGIYNPFFDYDGAGIINSVDTTIDADAIQDGQVNLPPAGPAAPSIIVTPSGNSANYTSGTPAVPVDPGIAISSDLNLTGATLAINNDQPGDTLNFSSQNGITGSYSSGTLTLGGTASSSAYQAALQSVSFSTTSTNSTARSLSIVATDAGLDSDPAAESVNVTPGTAPPVVTSSGGNGQTFVLGESAVKVDPGVTVTSSDADLTGASMAIANYRSGDALHFTSQNGIGGNYNSDTGVLTLTGTASVGFYQTALQSVAFSTSSDNTTTCAITIVADDNSLASSPASEQVQITLNPPNLTSGGTPASYTVGGSAVVVDPGAKVVTGSDADITSATLVLTNQQLGDTLNFSSQNGITSSYSSGTLTLSGTATVADYQTALESVSFSSSNATTPSITPRLVTIQADDSAASLTTSDTITDTIDVTIPAPTVTAGGSPAQYTAGAAAVTVDGGITVNSDDTGHMTGATMVLTNAQNGDTLNFTSQNGITGSYSSGTLTLGGTASSSAYQTALQSVTFSSTSTSTLARSISVQVDDSIASPSTSGTAADTIDVTIPAPTVTAGGSPAQYTAGAGAVTVDGGIKVNSIDTGHMTGATMVLTNAQSGDTLNFTSQNGITGSYSSGTLTLGGTASSSAYQTALQSVTFSSTSTSTLARSISVQVDDSIAQPEHVEHGHRYDRRDNSSSNGHGRRQPGAVHGRGGRGDGRRRHQGQFHRHRPYDRRHDGADQRPKRRHAQFHQPEWHHRQLQLRHADPRRHGQLVGVPNGLAERDLQLDEHQHPGPFDFGAGRRLDASPSTSSTATDTIDVYAPATVTALYVKGSAWTSSFVSYLGSHNLGNAATPTLGYALQTGTNQSKDLPWLNINVIEATFSEAVNVSQSSLLLTGGTQSGYSTPSVTGFSSLGANTYAWTLSTALTRNRLEISFLSTGANAVTDTRGAGLSGNWTNGTSTFSPGSGDGLAGTASGPNSGVTSDFNFLFNALPGDSLRNGASVNSTDYLDVRGKVGNSTASTAYSPYYDVLGTGSINSTSYLDVRSRVGNSQTASLNAPGPQDSAVGGLTTSGDDADLSGAMLAVEEGSTSQTGGAATQTLSNQTAGGTTSSPASGSSSGTSSTGGLPSDTDAIDAAVTDFDLADLYV